MCTARSAETRERDAGTLCWTSRRGEVRPTDRKQPASSVCYEFCRSLWHTVIGTAPETSIEAEPAHHVGYQQQRWRSVRVAVREKIFLSHRAQASTGTAPPVERSPRAAGSPPSRRPPMAAAPTGSGRCGGCTDGQRRRPAVTPRSASSLESGLSRDRVLPLGGGRPWRPPTKCVANSRCDRI